MRLLVIFCLLLNAGLVQAQYRCEVNGKKIYSDVPCASDAKFVGTLQDDTNPTERIRRERQLMGERSELQSLEHAKRQDDARQSRLISETQAADRAAASERCAQARRTGSRLGMREDCY